MNTQFKVGDKVRVLAGQGWNTVNYGLIEGEVYIVNEVYNDSLGIKGTRLNFPDYVQGWWKTRFELVVDVPVKTSRDKATGRFITKDSAPNKPVVFKRGSLYLTKRKKGAVVARLRNLTFGNRAVLDVHGKPFFTKLENLRIADKAQVNQYLAAER